MNNKLYITALGIIIFFSLFGVLFVANVIHEYSHKLILEDKINDKGYICYFAYPINSTLKELILDNIAVGYVKYSFNDNVSEFNRDEIKKWIEPIGYSSEIIVFLIYFFAIIVITIKLLLNNRYKYLKVDNSL